MERKDIPIASKRYPLLNRLRSRFLVPNNPLELLERSELQKHSSGKLGPKVSSASQRDDKRHGAQLTRQEHKTERIPLLV